MKNFFSTFTVQYVLIKVPFNEHCAKVPLILDHCRDKYFMQVVDC